MQLILVLAVLAVLVISENSPTQPVTEAAVRLAIAAVAMLAVPLFAVVSSGLIARQARSDFAGERLLLRYHRMKHIHTALWLAAAAGVAYGLDWTQLVRYNWHMEHTLIVDDLLILLPVLLPLVLSWAAFYDADRAILKGHVRISAAEPMTTRLGYVAVHARHYLGIVLVPLLVILIVQDGLELLAPQLLEGDYELLVFVPALAILMATFPLLLRFVWQTRPLAPGALRDRLETACCRSGVGLRDILVWETNSMAVNAAVAGFFPRLRYVFITDGLLKILSDEEIEAVLGHELGHIRHRHLLMRIIAMMAPLGLWILLGQVFPEQMDGILARMESWLEQSIWSGQPAIILGLAALALFGVYAIVIFGMFSRMLEKQADLFGCRILTEEFGHKSVDIYVRALEKLGIASGNRHCWSWQHGSIAERVEFLSKTAQSPQSVLCFFRRIRVLSSMLAALLILPLLHLLLDG
ncbi:MAG: M48 family metalloprotease [Pirellulales bacterium]|nr:M48 family metalloprotease [Pirellulales bacterium]